HIKHCAVRSLVTTNSSGDGCRSALGDPPRHEHQEKRTCPPAHVSPDGESSDLRPPDSGRAPETERDHQSRHHRGRHVPQRLPYRRREVPVGEGMDERRAHRMGADPHCDRCDQGAHGGGHRRLAPTPAAIPANAPRTIPRRLGTPRVAHVTAPAATAATSAGRESMAAVNSPTNSSGTAKSSDHSPGTTGPTTNPRATVACHTTQKARPTGR